MSGFQTSYLIDFTLACQDRSSFFPSPLSTFEVQTEFNSYRDRVVWWNHMAFPLLVRLSVGWGYQFIEFAKHQEVDNISELKAVNTNWGKWKFLFTWY